jgi:group I intron endonuclease
MKIKLKDLPNGVCGIYKINFPNGKIYIGQSVDIKRRIMEHNTPSAAKTPCDKAINKYGKIVEIELLEYTTQEELNLRE